ncbi:hypothetical protein ACFW9F_01445 [Streptomyces sp. NPDC059506]|uniref:hypothetical protein n=1 Tax=Streptomyces sp. NPDC059506 TaxID=3347751 RepID=UPI0036BA9FCA
MSEHDQQAEESSLRKAVQLLQSGDDEAAPAAVREAAGSLSDGPGPGWTPEQERQIEAMVGQLRKVRALSRPDAGWWRRQREWRARQRLADLATRTDGMELLNEAELRLWKNRMMVEVLLEFAGTAMRPGDVQLAMSRMETVHATAYEDLKRVKQKLTAQDRANSRP